MMERNEMLMTQAQDGGINIRMGYNWARYDFTVPVSVDDDGKPWLRMVKLQGNTPYAVTIDGTLHAVKLAT